jgi:signal peptidase II
LLIAVDLILKAVVENAYQSGNDWNFVVIPNLIEVRGLSYNTGAAFSFLANKEWGQIFLIVFTFIMLAALIFLYLILPEKYVLLKLALSLIVAGAIGNLVDRIAFRQVRDFVWVNIFGFPANCNFADFWIVFGTILAAIDILFIADFSVFPLRKSVREEQKKAKEEANNAATMTESKGAEQKNYHTDEKIAEGDQTDASEHNSNGG